MFVHALVLRSAAVACAATLLVAAACAQSGVSAPSREDCLAEFTPQTGQPGKDVIWVPTNDRLVTRMLQMAKTTPQDIVYDLGAGDGKIAIAAAKEFGATAVGVEYNPDMAKLGQCYARAEGVADKVKIIQGDIFETDFSDATVVTLYLLPDLNLKLRPTLLEMKPGTRVVSHSFMMGEWEPDERSMTQDGSAYLWIVPAEVQGAWTFRERDGTDAFGIVFEQAFQHVTGTVGTGPSATLIADGRLTGSEIEFSLQRNGRTAKARGQVHDDRIDLTVTEGSREVVYIGTRS
ncbi:MAG: class I SAM-dependent methyltransferase [Proteobacteria bacterium]|nr:MAG: class I SAM-dependent methyltransferase [Pseudomonadota bacterium]